MSIDNSLRIGQEYSSFFRVFLISSLTDNDAFLFTLLKPAESGSKSGFSNPVFTKQSSNKKDDLSEITMDPISLTTVNNSDTLDVNKIFSPNIQEKSKAKKPKEKKIVHKKGIFDLVHKLIRAVDIYLKKQMENFFLKVKPLTIQVYNVIHQLKIQPMIRLIWSCQRMKTLYFEFHINSLVCMKCILFCT